MSLWDELVEVACDVLDFTVEVLRALLIIALTGVILGTPIYLLVHFGRSLFAS